MKWELINSKNGKETYLLLLNGFILIRMEVREKKVFSFPITLYKFKDEYSFFLTFADRKDIENVKNEIIELLKF